MKIRHGWFGGLVAVATLIPPQNPGSAGEPTPAVEVGAGAGPMTPAPGAASTPGLLATQVGVAVDRDGSRRRFRATVLRVDEGVLTIVTAAHCLSEADRGWPAILLFEGGTIAEGVVEAVTRNPLYRPAQPRELPGPDNAIAQLRFRLGEAGPGSNDGRAGVGAPAPTSARPLGTRAEPRLIADPAALAAFRSIRRIESLAGRAYPAPGGGTAEVRVIDGRGTEHAVRAGNYSNPRWLEWGKGYQPIPGDSGGGVFVLAPRAGGPAQPVLIGVIVGRDDRGGGASLVSFDQPWVARALRAADPATRADARPAPQPDANRPAQ